MARFSAPVTAYFEVEIEAADRYEADEKLRSMNSRELKRALDAYAFPEYDTDPNGELPEEIG